MSDGNRRRDNNRRQQRCQTRGVLMGGCFRFRIENPTKIPLVDWCLSNASVAPLQHSLARPWGHVCAAAFFSYFLAHLLAERGRR